MSYRVHENTGVVEVINATEYESNAGHSTSVVTCGRSGRSWDDAVVTSVTPAPAARCPFEWECNCSN